MGITKRIVAFDYYPDTDSLYIELSDEPSTESQEVTDGVVLDFGEEGTVVGIDIDHASRKVQLKQLVVVGMPGPVERAG